MSDTPVPRSLQLEIEVIGTPEQVWAAIATGPGISSWYVPSAVAEEEGGAVTQRFGPGPEMQVDGRVAVWDPPHRVVFDGGPDAEGRLAFEWLVEAREGGTCVVRLVNTGFGSGAEWDAQYHAMAEGWLLFLHNLRLHLAHFAGRHGTALLPTAMWAGPREAAWTLLTTSLGLPPTPVGGEHVRVSGVGPPLAGTVESCDPGRRLTLLLEDPAPGTAFLAVEGDGDQVGVSVWLYLYGATAAASAARDEPAWSAWLAARAPTPGGASAAT